jgi:hypothetical protein
MKRVITGTVFNFSQSELHDMVNPDTIQRIKASDPNPVFKAFVIAHEGEADGILVGQGRKIFKYFRDAIMKVGSALKMGTAVFFRHADEGNSHINREPIGETVGKMFKEIGGKLHAIATFYIYPAFRDVNLQSASIEADIELSLEGGREVRVEDVQDITGVALSDRDKPAFPGATLLATMHAFSEDEEREEDLSDPAQNDFTPKSEPVPVTLDDFKNEVAKDAKKKHEAAQGGNDFIPPYPL